MKNIIMKKMFSENNLTEWNQIFHQNNDFFTIFF